MDFLKEIKNKTIINLKTSYLKFKTTFKNEYNDTKFMFLALSNKNDRKLFKEEIKEQSKDFSKIFLKTFIMFLPFSFISILIINKLSEKFNIDIKVKKTFNCSNIEENPEFKKYILKQLKDIENKNVKIINQTFQRNNNLDNILSLN